MRPTALILLYIVLGLAEIVCEGVGFTTGVYVFKPLMMVVLLVLYLRVSSGHRRPVHKFMAGALVLSWFGDVFLMVKHLNEELLFLLGLSSFLIAHLFYVLAFSRTEGDDERFPGLRTQPWAALLLGGYGIGLILWLSQRGNEAFTAMQVPVMVYASVILLMVLFAVGRRGRVNAGSYGRVLAGALMFAASDSVIALNTFTPLFEGNAFLARVIIMTLYLGGQMSIALGMLDQFELRGER